MRLATTPDGYFSSGLAQEREFAAEFVKHGDEARGRGLIRGVDLLSRPECFDNQIDGSVVQMESTAVGKKSYLGSLFHESDLGDFPGASGQGFSGRKET